MSEEKNNIIAYRNQLKAAILEISPQIVLSELNELIEEFEYDFIPKKHNTLEKGETSDTIYFICSGLIRIFYQKDGKELTNWIVKENMIFSGIYSVLLGNKSHSIYEAIEDTHVLTIKVNVLESFYAKYHSIEHLGRRIVQIYYGDFIKKNYSVQFLSAEERYQLFIKDYEDLLNRLPLRVIASYLNITQETLSRIRGKH